MRQLTIGAVFLILATQAKALPPELKKDYDEFKKNYQSILELPADRKLFREKFKKLEQELNEKYTRFGSKEGQTLSSESNQMALDIEMLEPLKIVAEGDASKESCSNAEFINELNNTSDPKMYKKIKAQIKKICR